MELFCPDTEVQDIMLNNMEKDKLRVFFKKLFLNF